MEAAGQSNQYSAANVEAAVVNFYCNGGANPDTHTWLTSAQMSPAAWTFAWELLSAQKKPEVQFFGASTIALKVGRFFHEVPSDQYEGLRRKIVDLLTGYKGPHIVRTRLCVAMADLLIHSIPDRWSGPVPDVINLFGQGSTGHAPTILLELLTVIPEEYSTLALPSQKRSHIRAELSGSLRHVLPLIQQVLDYQQSSNRGDSENAMQAIKCLQAWVQFGVPMEEMSPLIDRVLASVRDEELFDCSLDALSSIVSHPDTHKYVNLLKHLLERILTLEPMLSQLVNEGSYEMASPLVCLFVTFGESHSRMLIDWATGEQSGGNGAVVVNEQGKELSVRLLRIILAVSSVPAQFPIAETISEMPFGFWYIFQDDMIACEPAQFQQCGQIFGPIYQMLVDSLLRKAMYNLKENEWTPDQRESFRCYRTDIADTIMYCFNILRENLLALLLKHVEEATTLNLQDPARNWPYLEASLYVWSAVAESLAEEEDECPILTQFLAKLPTLPYNNNMKVISSALDCIGGFAEWLAMHPNLLPHVAPIVTSALQNPDLALCATMALKDMCRDCADGMKPYAQEVINACEAALKSNQLKSGECVRLMYSVGKMLSLMPAGQILPKLEPILSPYLAELQSIAGQEATPQLKPRVDFILKLLTTLFQSLEIPTKNGEIEISEAQKQALQQQNPVFVLFPQIYPLLKQLAEKWIRDADIIETMCNLLKQCVTTLMDGIRPFTNDMVMLLVQCYGAIPHSCMLDLARNFFVLFAKEDAMQPLMQGFFKHIVSKTMSEMTSSSNPSDYSDLIASFFGIMSQVIKKAPALLATEGVDLIGLFTAACGCLGMPENGPVKNSAQFLSHFIGISRDMNQLSAIINHHGEALFLTTIRCIGGESARSFTDYYVDILFALNKKYFDNLRQWLTSMVNMDNFPTANVTKEQKHQFATFVLRERANKRKLLEVTREFSLACCGLAGTEYAMQMGQVMAVWDRIGMKQEAKAEAAS